jgi:hypothetical protein
LLIDCVTGRKVMVPKRGEPNAYTMSLTGGHMSTKKARMLTRSLYKILLGYICLDSGRHEALSGRFDEARAMIMGRTKFSGYLAMIKNVTPSTELRFTYEPLQIDGKPTIGIVANFFGVLFVTDLDRRHLADSSAASADFNIWEF